MSILSADEARAHCDRLPARKRALAGLSASNMRHEPHRPYTIVSALIDHPVIVDAVEDIITETPADPDAVERTVRALDHEIERTRTHA